jgi:hypothetical protein
MTGTPGQPTVQARELRQQLLGQGFAVLAVIAGQALLLSRPVLLTWAAAVGIASGAFVRGYEQPVLARRYGARYEAYRREVPGWWPRLPRARARPPR